MVAPNPPNALRVGADIAERLLEFGATCVGVADQVPRTDIGRHVALQLARSATGAGANYEEARAAESAADFAHKVAIATKEMREAGYWVRLIARAKLVPDDLDELAREAFELAAILGASTRTARKRQDEERVRRNSARS